MNTKEAFDRHRIKKLYCDGGLIKINPSPYGGTYAFIALDEDDKEVYSERGLILYENNTALDHIDRLQEYISGKVSTSPHITIGNNETELFAMVSALEIVPKGWVGDIYSDSENAIIRITKMKEMINVSPELELRMILVHNRLKSVQYHQLDGHPTRLQLQSGVGKRGNPVSIHNHWCDKSCSKVAELYSRFLQEGTHL